MKILVTGATGYIGAYLCNKLSLAGHEISAFKFPEEYVAHIKEHIHEFIPGNLLDLDSCITDKEYDVVIHLANIRGFSELNVIATKNLLKSISLWKKKPHIIYTSSLMAAGPSGKGIIDEKHTPKPNTSYGRSKIESENLIIRSGLDYTILRTTAVFGNNNPTSKQLIKLVSSGFGFIVKGSQKNKISFVHVDDVVNAIVKVTDNVNQLNEIYFLSSDLEANQKEIIQVAAELMNKRIRMIHIPKGFANMILTVVTTAYKFIGSKQLRNFQNALNYQILTADHSFVCSAKKLRKELNWEPEYVDLKKAIQTMIG
ncbi:MAG: NAD(P)-dependent oxidoreductase [Flavobacteriales bacterium]|nr:NAD(P)-dependent oxidoreductase [Flavobacteriales bacterium]